MPTATLQPPATQPRSNFLERRLLVPLRDLLLTGITPQRLAWSLAIGAVIGINPLIGSATALTFAAAFALRLNVVAAQLANYLVYPLQLALLLAFLRTGSAIFRIEPIPFTRADILALAHHPIAAAQILWRWESRALLIWLACAAVLAPLLATVLTPALKRLLAALEQPVA